MIPVGQPERVTELVRDDRRVLHVLAGAVGGALRDVVQHLDRITVHADVVGHERPDTAVVQIRSMRPNRRTATRHRHLQVLEGDQIHVAVVVSAVGHPVRPVVVVEGEVDVGIQLLQGVEEELPGALTDSASLGAHHGVERQVAPRPPVGVSVHGEHPA